VARGDRREFKAGLWQWFLLFEEALRHEVCAGVSLLRIKLKELFHDVWLTLREIALSLRPGSVDFRLGDLDDRPFS